MQDKYINLFTDFGFKKIFGTESNKDLLIHFLNTILAKELSNPIKDITYGKTEFLSRRAKDRKVIFDLYCTNDRQEKFIIELQRAQQAFFKDRSVYYATFPIQEQGKKGDWDYELLPVYTVAIMDFEFSESPTDKVISYVKLREQDSSAPFFDKLTFVYVEMPKFLKNPHELGDILDKWLYVFKHLHELDKMPPEVQEGIFIKLFKQCEIANYSPKEAMKYKESWKIYNDNKNVMDFAIAKAEEKGIEIGIEKERALSEQRQVSTAVYLLRNTHFSDVQIAEATQLPIETIDSLRQKLQDEKL